MFEYPLRHIFTLLNARLYFARHPVFKLVLEFFYPVFFRVEQIAQVFDLQPRILFNFVYLSELLSCYLLHVHLDNFTAVQSVNSL